MSPYSWQRNNWIFLYFCVFISCKHHQETFVPENCSKRLDIAVCKYLVRLTPLCLFYWSYLDVFLVSSWNVSSFWRSGFSFSLKTQRLFFAIKTNQGWAKDFGPSVKGILDKCEKDFDGDKILSWRHMTNFIPSLLLYQYKKLCTPLSHSHQIAIVVFSKTIFVQRWSLPYHDIVQRVWWDNDTLDLILKDPDLAGYFCPEPGCCISFFLISTEGVGRRRKGLWVQG